jgi:hypothetical protein
MTVEFFRGRRQGGRMGNINIYTILLALLIVKIIIKYVTILIVVLTRWCGGNESVERRGNVDIDGCKRVMEVQRVL